MENIASLCSSRVFPEVSLDHFYQELHWAERLEDSPDALVRLGDVAELCGLLRYSLKDVQPQQALAARDAYRRLVAAVKAQIEGKRSPHPRVVTIK